MENKVLPLGEMKRIVADCFAPVPWVYWSDLLLTALLAWGSFLAGELAEGASPRELTCFLISVFAFYRGILFIHELTHRERSELPGFSVAWNLLFGVPLLLPSFMYRGVHLDHHRGSSYGTEDDGEYLPFGASPLSRSILYFGQAVLLPFLLVLRFGLLAPISLLHPGLRRLVMSHSSALAIRMDTARRLPAGEDLRNWGVLEVLGFAYVACIALLVSRGVIGLPTLRHAYLLIMAIGLVNSLRTLVAHRYRNRSGKAMSFAEQYEDSVNVEGPGWLMALIAPVGLRHHALHHLFPTIPYHHMQKAHQRLCAELPADSPYRAANEPSLWSALQTHWRNTRSATTDDGIAQPGSQV